MTYNSQLKLPIAFLHYSQSSNIQLLLQMRLQKSYAKQLYMFVSTEDLL